jgi:LPS export ABC transporter protein LptC
MNTASRVHTVMTQRNWGVRAMAAAVGMTVAVWWHATASAPATSFGDGPRLVSAQQAERASQPFVEIQGTRLSGADHTGQRQWELQAQSVQLDKDRTLVALVGITGWLYHNGKQQIRLGAARATYASKSNTVELNGGVVGSVLDGRRFEADTVRWTAGGRLDASGRIVFIQPGLTIRAERMRADAGLEHVTFEGHVAITVVP